MKNIVTGVFLLAILVSAGGCGGKKEPVKKEKIFPVEVVSIKEEKISQRLNVIGNLSSQTLVNIISPEEGKVSEFLVEEGDIVEENQVVAKISGKEREALVSPVLGEFNSLQKELSTCGDESKREKLKAEIEEVKQELDFVLQQYQETIITSPVTGTVIRRFVDQGDILTAKAKLMAIADMDDLIVKCNIPELDIAKLKQGQKTVILFDAFGENVFSGRVAKIYPALDETTRSVPVEIQILDNEPALKIGMFARVSIIVEEKNTFVLPQDAVIKQLDGKKVVFKVEKGVAEKTEVMTGIKEKDRIEIISGIKKGDLIIINGQHSLKEGMKVNPVRSEAF